MQKRPQVASRHCDVDIPARNKSSEWVYLLSDSSAIMWMMLLLLAHRGSTPSTDALDPTIPAPSRHNIRHVEGIQDVANGSVRELPIGSI